MFVYYYDAFLIRHGKSIQDKYYNVIFYVYGSLYFFFIIISFLNFLFLFYI